MLKPVDLILVELDVLWSISCDCTWLYVILQAHPEHQWDQDRRWEGQGMGASLHGEETVVQAPEATSVWPWAQQVSPID